MEVTEELPGPTHMYDARQQGGHRGRIDLKPVAAKNGTYVHITYRYPGLNCSYKGPLLSRAGAEALIADLRSFFPEEQERIAEAP